MKEKWISSKYFKLDLLTTLFCFLPVLLGLCFYEKLPGQIAIHFNSSGQPDNYAGKAFAVFGIPIFMALMHLILCIISTLDKKAQNVAPAMQYFVRFVIPVLSLLTQTLTILYALEYKIHIGRIINIFLGFLLLFIGNLLPKCKYNYTIGIRLPSTFSSEEIWNKTHRMGGFVWVIGSIFVIICAILDWNITVFWIMIAMVLIPVVYSYLLLFQKKF